MISRKRVKQDLQWYYGQAHASLGISSSFGSMVSSAFGFAPSSGINYYEDKFIGIVCHQHQPIKKLRHIEQILSKLSKKNRRILDACYESYAYPPQLISVFGIKTGAALFNSHLTELSKLLQLCSKKLSRQTLSSQDSSLFQQIQEEANKLYDQAHDAYRQVK